MALKSGDILNNRYEIKELVGQGAFSVAYRAYDPILKDDLAVKVFNPESAARFGDPREMQKRFVQEAQITRRLEHPHIIEIYDLNSSNDLSFIVMRYLPYTLADWLERLTIPEAVQIMLQICDGLGFAHSRQIVHCDIKPNNILFDKNSQVKISDFGIAHVPRGGDTTGPLTTTVFGAGTVFYMSPEQLEGRRDDPRIDVYALGALFYRMLTGGHYYVDFDLSGTIQAQAENILRVFTETPISSHLENVPEPLAVIALKALLKNPEDRYADAGEMLEAIKCSENELLALHDTVFEPIVHLPLKQAKALLAQLGVDFDINKRAFRDILILYERTSEDSELKVLTLRAATQLVDSAFASPKQKDQVWEAYQLLSRFAKKVPAVTD